MKMYSVTKDTFISTILYGIKTKNADPKKADSPHNDQKNLRLSSDTESKLHLLTTSTQCPASLLEVIKKNICAYAGVQSGERWRVIEAAAGNLKKMNDSDDH